MYHYKIVNNRYGIMERHSEAPEVVVDTLGEAELIIKRFNAVAMKFTADKKSSIPLSDILKRDTDDIGDSSIRARPGDKGWTVNNEPFVEPDASWG